MSLIPQDWWRNARVHFRPLDGTSTMLSDRSDLAAGIEFIATQLDLKPGARILDLCCGPGRYVVELARRGLEVVGLDLNEHFVELARELLQREVVSAEIVQGDMREIPFHGHFDAAINVGSSFGFFAEEAEDRKVLAGVSEALKPGGAFVLEMGNREYLLGHFRASESIDNEDGTTTCIERQFDCLKGRIDCTFREIGSGQTPIEWHHSWRAYTLAELGSMLSDAHMEVTSVLGGWDRETYGADARRLVVISRKQTL